MFYLFLRPNIKWAFFVMPCRFRQDELKLYKDDKNARFGPLGKDLKRRDKYKWILSRSLIFLLALTII